MVGERFGVGIEDGHYSGSNPSIRPERLMKAT